MIPIQDLLNRIKWDKEFGQGCFEIGYYDRIDHKIIKVQLRQLDFDPDDHFFFKLTDLSEEVCSIPYHRVRQVYKDGQLIWSRG